MSITSHGRSGLDGSTPSRPPRQHHNPALARLPLLVAGTDLALIALTGALAAVGRTQLSVTRGPLDQGDLSVAGPLVLLAWLLTIALSGGYRAESLGTGPEEYGRVLNASLITFGVVGVGCYLAKFDLARSFYLLTFAFGIPLLLLGRWVIRRALHTARRRGHLQMKVLIAGTRSHVDDVARVLSREQWLGYSVAGALLPADDPSVETPSGVPVIGSSDDVARVSDDTDADVIIFAGGSVGSASHMRRTLWTLEQQQVRVIVAPSVSDISEDRIRVRPVGGLPLIHVERAAWADAARWGKRAFDLIGSSLIILALAPVLLLLAVRIKTHDRGVVLFRQERVGLRGTPFSCLKFRTMVPDAEEQLRALHEAAGYHPSQGLFKMDRDPRITAPGRTLRRFSLDELPQLFNVFMGHMSLVGPRPPLPTEVAAYTDDIARRLHVRPGMTGLWQVSGRSDLTWDEAVRLDLYYVDNWSMLQDLSILVRTIGAVFGSRGAY